MESFFTGVIAGYGIAIPVGAIAVLIVEVGIRCGFRCAFAAALGAATADLTYASAAVIGGSALAGLVESVDQPLRILSAVALAVIGVFGLRRVGGALGEVQMAYPDRRQLATTYARFFGLTIINPITIVYFAALVVGLGVAAEMTAIEGGRFAIGAFLASLSWQTVLAGVGATAGNRLSPTVQKTAVIIGNLVILAFAGLIFFRR